MAFFWIWCGRFVRLTRRPSTKSRSSPTLLTMQLLERRQEMQRRRGRTSIRMRKTPWSIGQTQIWWTQRLVLMGRWCFLLPY